MNATAKIDVTRDAEGLCQAAFELMEETLDAPERERLARIAEMATNRDAMLEAIPSRRTLSPGYYLWIEYVVDWIVAPMESGILFREADLRVDELRGLAALREGRARFRSEHPPCARCRKPMAKSGRDLCDDCAMAKLREEGGR